MALQPVKAGLLYLKQHLLIFLKSSLGVFVVYLKNTGSMASNTNLNDQRRQTYLSVVRTLPLCRNVLKIYLLLPHE